MSNTNTQEKESLFTDENFKKLSNTIHNIRNTIHAEFEEKSRSQNQDIYNSLNELEKEFGIKPSFKNFINKLITEEDLLRAENEIIEEMRSLEMIGYQPDIKNVTSRIITDENIKKIEESFRKQFKALDI